MAAGYQPEGVCPGNNGKYSSGVSDRHAVLFKTVDDGSVFPLGMKYYERMIRQAEEKGRDVLKDSSRMHFNHWKRS